MICLGNLSISGQSANTGHSPSGKLRIAACLDSLRVIGKRFESRPIRFKNLNIYNKEPCKQTEIKSEPDVWVGPCLWALLSVFTPSLKLVLIDYYQLWNGNELVIIK